MHGSDIIQDIGTLSDTTASKLKPFPVRLLLHDKNISRSHTSKGIDQCITRVGHLMPTFI